MDITDEEQQHTVKSYAIPSAVNSTANLSNAETIANRVRKRHRDVVLRSPAATKMLAKSTAEEELAQLSDFVGILPVLPVNSVQHGSQDTMKTMSNMQETIYLDDNGEERSESRLLSVPPQFMSNSSFQQNEFNNECVMISRGGGRSYLCNQCPFEASELVTVFRHLFAAHVFRCGRCNFYCTSRWKLRRHEQGRHNAFIDEEYAIEPLSVRPDPVGDGFILMQLKSNETIARLPSSRTPRLMNGLAGFVPSSIVTPIAVKNQNNSWRSGDRTLGTTSSPTPQPQQHKVNTSYLFDNKYDNLGYKCKRCEYTSMLLGKMKSHCSQLAEYAYICPATCHFGSSVESEVREHFVNCPNANMKSNMFQQTINFINKDRYNIEKFFCTYDPKDDNSSAEFEDMGSRLNPDADLMKQIGEPGIFLLKKNVQEDESLSLIDQISVYGSKAAEKMYPQLSNKRPRGKIPLIIRGSGLATRSNKVGYQSAYQTALNEFLKSRHQFILSSEEIVDLPCPTEQSVYVQCVALPAFSPHAPLSESADDVIVLDEE